MNTADSCAESTRDSPAIQAQDDAPARYASRFISAIPDPLLPTEAIRLDKLQTSILKTLYARSEQRHPLPDLARAVFPGAAAYPDAELLGFVLPRLMRMKTLDFVRLERRGGTKSAAISLKGIEFVERQA